MLRRLHSSCRILVVGKALPVAFILGCAIWSNAIAASPELISLPEAKLAAKRAGYRDCEDFTLKQQDWICVAEKRGKSVNVILDGVTGEFKSTQVRRERSDRDRNLSVIDCDPEIGEKCSDLDISGERTESAETCAYTGADCPNKTRELIFGDRNNYKNVPNRY